MERKKVFIRGELTEEDIEFRKKLKDDLFFKVFKELGSMKGNPRSQIFVAHGFLELLIHTIAKSKAKNGKKIAKDTRTYSYAVQLVILHEMGELSDDDYKLFEWFRKLRNTAAHEPLFSITSNDLSSLPEKFRNVNRFYQICQELMLKLWNKNKELLVPVFIPTLAPKMKEKGK